MCQYFPKLYEHSGANVKIELNLSNYAKKANLKGATSIETSTLASKADLASLETKVDNLDVDNLKTVPADLGKLSNVVGNDVVKKTVYNQWVTKVNATDTKIPSASRLVTKTQAKQGLEKKIEDVNKKIPNTRGLVKKAEYNAKITEIENKIPSVVGLVITAALNTKVQ